MGQIYEGNTTGTYEDLYGRRLILRESTNTFHYPNGDLFRETDNDNDLVAQGSDEEKKLMTPRGKIPTAGETVLVPKQEVPVKEITKIKQSKDKQETKQIRKAVDNEVVTLENVSTGAQFILQNNTPLTLITALILSWLSPLFAGIGAFLLLNNKKLSGGAKAGCFVFMVLSLFYSTSILNIVENSYKSSTDGVTEDLNFVLSINPGQTELKEFQTAVKKTGYTVEVSEDNNAIIVMMPTMECTVYFNRNQNKINALEINSNRDYRATIYPLNINISTESMSYIFNLSEVDVGDILNNLETTEQTIDAYVGEVTKADTEN